MVYQGMKMDLLKKILIVDGDQVNLTRKEFEILSLLMKNMDQYISRDEILQKIWNDDVIVTERNVDVNIARLRKKIAGYGDCIKGKSGYGYCFHT